jgi:hypothetical protein
VFIIHWCTMDGGVELSGAGGTCKVNGTIGQPDGGPPPSGVSAGDYTLVGGFWPGMPACSTFVAPDFDYDCDVDQADYTVFEVCASGPDVPLAPGCEDKDFDNDGDEDHSDFATLQRCFSGEDSRSSIRPIISSREIPFL